VSEPGFHTAFTDHGGNPSSADANCSHLGGGQSLGTDIENGLSDMVDPGMTGYGTGLLTNGPFYGFQGPGLSAFANNTQHHGHFSFPTIEPPHSPYCAYIQRHIEMENSALRQQVAELQGYVTEQHNLLKHARETGFHHANILTGDVEVLKNQLRSLGRRPCIDPVISEVEKFWEEQFGVVFKELFFWANEHYQLPTRLEMVPMDTQIRLLTICHNMGSLSNGLSSPHTKPLIIVSLATRWLANEILTTEFLETFDATLALHKKDSEVTPIDGGVCDTFDAIQGKSQVL
jgi:hypothetical protein